MLKENEIEVTVANTEEKIKNAARTVFQKKGYAATRTRDIAEEAGINLALLNYYFRSKEKLFNIIMRETVFEFLQGMLGFLNDENTSFEKKIKLFVGNYIDMLTEKPDILPFILNEVRTHSEDFLTNFPARQVLTNSVFVQQFQEKAAKGEIKKLNPIQFFMNMMGLTAFPFLVKPLISAIGIINEEEYNQMLQERKNLIPVWIKAIMK